MKAIGILTEEHRLIEQVLRSLELAAMRAAEQEKIRPMFFGDAADFVSAFADALHHRKEEEVLFQAMARTGMQVHDRMLQRMLSEHEQSRDLTSGMREAARRWSNGDRAARDEVVEEARGCIWLLRQHIAREEQMVFTAAERLLPRGPQQDELARGLQQIDLQSGAAASPAMYVALANALARELQ